MTSLNLSINSTAFHLKRSNVLKRNGHCTKLKRSFPEELSWAFAARPVLRGLPAEPRFPARSRRVRCWRRSVRCVLAELRGRAAGPRRSSPGHGTHGSVFPQKFLLSVPQAQLVRTALRHGRPTVTAPSRGCQNRRAKTELSNVAQCSSKISYHTRLFLSSGAGKTAGSATSNHC